MMPEHLSATAVHDAGHAVIGRALTLICGPATIEADEDSIGHSITYDPYQIHEAWEISGKFRDMASVFRGRIMCLMAGREAEEELLGRSQGGDGADLEEVHRVLRCFPVPNGDLARYEERLRRRTRELVRRHGRTIRTISDLLLERRTLLSEEIDAALPRSQAHEAVDAVRAKLRPFWAGD